jgi:hypothetical protein
MPHAGSLWIIAVAFMAATAGGGCASRLVEMDDPPANRRPTVALASEPRAQADAPHGAGLAPLKPDPRDFRTPDGRPAPYGRDPSTGRAIADGPLSSPAPPLSSLGSTKSGHAIVVAKGDTLAGLARRHGVAVGDIVRANGLSTDTIRVGQRLTIPQAAGRYGTIARSETR